MKTFFRNVHLYLSLVAGIIIFGSCLTGTLLVFEDEINHTMHHDRYFVQPQQQRLPLQQLIATAIQQIPKARLASVKVYTDAGRTVEISLNTPPKKGEGGQGSLDGAKPAEGEQHDRGHHAGQSKQGSQHDAEPMNGKGQKGAERAGGSKPGITVFMNPYTGKVADVFNRRKSFLFNVEMYHRFLLAGKDSLGNKIVGLSTLFFLFILLTGVYLWWPKTKKIMRQRLKIKFSGGWKRVNHDLHIVTGFYTSVFLIIIVTAGLIMHFKWANKALFAITGSKPEAGQPQPPASAYRPGQAALTIDDQYQQFAAAHPNAEWYNIRMPKDSLAALSVNMLAKNKVETAGDTYFADQYTGKIIGTQLFAEKSTGARARAFIKPIHTGSIYGVPTKIISFVVCLLSLMFPVTGVILWLSRIKVIGRKKNQARYSAAV